MPKGSYGRFIHVGLVGPKPRPRGVGDGQTVYIPLPPADDSSPGAGRGGDRRALRWRCSVQPRRDARPEEGGSPRATKDDPARPSPPRKAALGMPLAPVPQTDTGG